MANEINYAKVYSDTLAEAFPFVLHFGALYATPNNGRYRFTGGKTIEIPNIITSGRSTGSHDSIGDLSRNYENIWETKELTNQRQWSTVIHPKDIDQTNMALTISNITANFNNEHKFPEMDAYCVSKLYTDWTAMGNSPIEVELTAENILSTFDSIMEKMSERDVPVNGRYLYVTPQIMTVLKSVADFDRSISQDGSVNRTVTTLDGVTVVEVPSFLMRTAYDFSNDFNFASGAKKIQMLMVHPESVITPVSYQFAQLDEPSAVSGGKYVYYEESYEDVFLLTKRSAGVCYVTKP